MEHSAVIPSPIEDVIAWFSRPGAIDRLIPPWQPLRVVHEAESLASGEAILALPLGLRWHATHDPARYQPNRQFVDRLTNPVLGRLVPWTHVHSFEAVSPTQTRVTDRIETRVPDRFLAQNLAWRERQATGDLEAHARLGSRTGPMTVAVTGAGGLIGSALCAYLSTGGARVVRLVRTRPQAASRYLEDRHWDPTDPAADLLDGVDAVVHLAGSPVAGRFSAAHKAAVRTSRVEPTRRLARLVGDRPLTVASAVGIYGPDRGDEMLTEESERGDGFLADVVAEWEEAADPARQSGSRVTHVRTGIVQSPRGGMLAVLRRLFSVGAGGRLGSGRQWVPWIGIDDMLDIYLRCLTDQSLVGPVNAVAPNPVTNREYTETLARVLRRPALFPVPALGPRLLLGAEAASEFVMAGQNARPQVLNGAGHRYRHPDLEPALRHLLGRVATAALSRPRR